MQSYRRDLDMLRDRRFTLLLATRTISMLGSSFAPVALAFGVLGLPGSTATTLSVVLAAEAVPMVAFMLVGGVIADRLPRHRVMMAGEVLNAVAFACLAAMLLTGWTPLPALMTAAAVTGIAMAVFFPALTGIIPDVVPADRLQTANAVLGLGANGARVAGLVLSGATVVLLGGGWALAVSALMFAVAAVLVAALRLTPAERGAAGNHSVIADLRDGWREFVSRQWLWVVVAQFSVLVMAVQAAHGVLGPLVAKEHLGGAPAWSAVLAGEAVGMIGGVFIAMRLRPRRPILLGTVLTVPTALPYLLLGLGAPLWTVVLGAVVMGVCFDIFGVLWSTTMQREIPPESLSRVSSYDALGSLMFGPVGLLVAGPLAITIGPRAALLGCAAVVVLASLAALLSPGVRRLQAPEARGLRAPELAEKALSH
ncbi:MFS transporter [Streptosporangium sp. NBC_01756]|uniref:MFS transporter n=1 Tax=Streptosporangium sp. NBC_01756 TaxID=2975950 RepID=UPI002DDBA5C8|nr:MFS transporter [Streptosporangium sp. NBC_01756]WSC90263.1 MFS transporter [Streptosporangium sp. NBC_01756]